MTSENFKNSTLVVPILYYSEATFFSKNLLFPKLKSVEKWPSYVAKRLSSKTCQKGGSRPKCPPERRWIDGTGGVGQKIRVGIQWAF